MRFMLMTKPGTETAVPPSPELMAAIGNLTQEMKQAGKLIDTGGLQPIASGARLQLSGGKVTVTDGPFAEAKEVIGGYAIVKVDSREEAIELARRFLEIHARILGPSFELGSEVRQMYEPGDFAPPQR